MTGFPMPFGGIKNVFAIQTADEVIAALAYMNSGCGEHHQHNVAVEWDAGHSHARIWTTELGTDCLTRFFAEV